MDKKEKIFAKHLCIEEMCLKVSTLYLFNVLGKMNKNMHNYYVGDNLFGNHYSLNIFLSL